MTGQRIRYQRVGLKLERVPRPATGASPPEGPTVPASAGGSDPEPPLTAAAALALSRALARFARALRQDVRGHRHSTPRRYAVATNGIGPDELRRARLLTGLSQRELARELPFGRSTVAAAEEGVRPIPESLADWAADVLRASGQGAARQAARQEDAG